VNLAGFGDSKLKTVTICGTESDSIEGLWRVKCFECFELSFKASQHSDSEAQWQSYSLQRGPACMHSYAI